MFSFDFTVILVSFIVIMSILCFVRKCVSSSILLVSVDAFHWAILICFMAFLPVLQFKLVFVFIFCSFVR